MEKIINKIRNYFHVVGGFTVAYWLASITGLFNNNNFTTIFERMFLAVVALTMFTITMGAFFEYIMKQIDKETTPNNKDIIKTGVGGFIAALSTIEPYNPIVLITTTIICLIGVGFEIVRIIKKKIK